LRAAVSCRIRSLSTPDIALSNGDRARPRRCSRFTPAASAQPQHATGVTSTRFFATSLSLLCSLCAVGFCAAAAAALLLLLLLLPLLLPLL
jgi:hypothetical protein